MKLPNSHQARVEREKLTNYLLSNTNIRGRSKAEFFARFGFTAGNWREFAESLRSQGAAHEVVKIVETDYGPRYNVDGTIETPDGRNPQIRTVWQIDVGTEFPRLITARPLNQPRSRNGT